MLRNTVKVLAWVFAVGATLSVPVRAEQPTLVSTAASDTTRELEIASATSAEPPCELVAIPPVRLETLSKYDQTTASKSVIDEAAYNLRRQALAPIDGAIRQLEVMASTAVRTASPDPSTECVARNIEAWAAARTLTDMATMDANLTRDRFVASITGLLMDLKGHGRDLAAQPAVRAWLQSISDQTIRYYDRDAGTTSRRNNHRYWAGLSVGRIGYLLQDEAMLGWSRASLDVGLCQVDREGFLPLELARGKKAFDYHLFAFVALRSLSELLTVEARVEGSSCPEGLKRLQQRIEDGLVTVAAFESRSGYRQDVPSRRNLITATQLSLRSRASGDLRTAVSY